MAILPVCSPQITNALTLTLHLILALMLTLTLAHHLIITLALALMLALTLDHHIVDHDHVLQYLHHPVIGNIAQQSLIAVGVTQHLPPDILLQFPTHHPPLLLASVVLTCTRMIVAANGNIGR